MRSYKIAILALLCALLSGCTQARQVESIAFAVILGADLTEDEGIELTVQIPKVGGGSESEESSSGEPSDYLIASARGATFTDALMALEITVPRDLTLTQIKLLVVSERWRAMRNFLFCRISRQTRSVLRLRLFRRLPRERRRIRARAEACHRHAGFTGHTRHV